MGETRQPETPKPEAQQSAARQPRKDDKPDMVAMMAEKLDALEADMARHQLDEATVNLVGEHIAAMREALKGE